MATRPAFRIEYSPEASDHLEQMDARDSATILDNVDRKLQHEPTTATRNKKLLRANDLAPWELRVGNWRVYYEVGEDATGPVVVVKAVGLKLRDKVLIAGEEIEL